MLILRLLGGQSLIDISVLVLDHLRGKEIKTVMINIGLFY